MFSTCYQAEDPHFTWRYTALLTKGQFYTACGDVLDPTYLLPVTVGTGAGEMDHPSVITILSVTCRVRDLERYFFAGWFRGLLCGRASLHPRTTAASPLVANTQGVIWGLSFQQDSGGYAASPSVRRAAGVIRFRKQETIAEWVSFYWNSGIWVWFGCAVMLLL